MAMRVGIFLMLVILLSGCKQDTDSQSQSTASEPNTEDFVSAAPASVANLQSISNDRKTIRNISLKFLKSRGESNTAIAAIMGQAACETEDFRYMHELGSRKYLQYLEGRRDLGNIYPGDGPRFKGRGFIHLTGRDNYRIYGGKANVNLIKNPVLAERADYAILLMHYYLLSRRYRDTGYGHARKGNIRGLTNHINGGRNGYSKRIRYYQMYLAQLNAGKYNNIFGMKAPQTPSVKAFQRQRRRRR